MSCYQLLLFITDPYSLGIARHRRLPIYTFPLGFHSLLQHRHSDTAPSHGLAPRSAQDMHLPKEKKHPRYSVQYLRNMYPK